MKFCRYILGVNRKAPNIGIYGDSGSFPLCISRIIAFVKYWYRLETMNSQENQVLYNTYMNNTNENSIWYQSVCNILESIGETCNSARIKRFDILKKKILNKFTSDFIKGWYNELHNDNRKGNFGNKLRCYRTFKTKFGFEPYLSKCKNIIHRKHMTKLRLSAHKLHVETGRYTRGTDRLKPDERLCKHCNISSCEDEQHFMMICNLYVDNRTELFRKVEAIYSNFNSLDMNMKFNFLMSNGDLRVINAVAEFIYTSFMKRNVI